MKKNKKLLIGIGIVALFGAVALMCVKTSTEKSDIIKIGVNVPTSGPLAFWGEELRRGVDLYAEQLPNVKVVVHDNKGKPNEAVTSARTLIDMENVDAIVTMLVKLSAPQKPLAEKAKIPLVSTYNSSDGFTESFSYVYQDFATHEWQLPALSKFVIEELGLKSGAIFCSADDFGRDGEKFFRKYYTQLGGTISETFQFQPGSTDLRNDVSKVLSATPGFVFVVGQEKELIAAVKAIREIDTRLVILGVGSFESPSVWSGISDEQQNNLYFVNSAFDKNGSNAAKDFHEQYLNKYGAEPSMPSVYGFSICEYLVAALDRAKKSSSDVRIELDSVNEQSIRGVLSINKKREIVCDYGLYKREHGRSILLKSYKSASYEK